MAEKYWVGGTGVTNTTVHWSDTDGGASGAVLPTSADNINFTNLSATSNAAYTVTINASLDCANFTMLGPHPTNVNKVTWAGSSALNIYGNLNLSGGTAGITRTYTGTITFLATSSGKTIDTNGVTLASAVTISGAGGGWTLSNDFNNSAQNFTYSASSGNLDTNGKTLSVGNFLGQTNTKTWTLGASTINCSGFQLNSSDTFNSNTSTIAIAGNGGLFGGGGKTFNIVSIAPTSTWSITGANNYTTLTIAPTGSGGLSFTLAANQTISGTLTVTGVNANTTRVFILSDTKGTQRTLSAGTIVSSNADYQDIVASGASSPWNLSSGIAGDCGNNSNITFSAPTTYYWKHGGTASVGMSTTANWFTATNGGGSAGRVPLPQDTAVFDSNSFSASGKTVTQDCPRVGAIDFSLVTNSPTFTTSTAASIYGSLTLADSGHMILTASSQTYTVENRSGTVTLTSAGQSWSKPWTINNIGGNFSLGDDFTIASNSAFTITTVGIFNDNNHNFTTAGVINSNNSNTRTITMGSGIYTFSSNTTTIWNINYTNCTFTPPSNPILLTYSGSSGTRTVQNTNSGATEANSPSFSVTSGTDIINLNTCKYKNLNFTGFSGSITNTANTIYGNITLGGTMTDGANTNTLAATSGTQVITSNGVTWGGAITQSGVGGTVTLGDNFVMPSGRTYTHSNGTFNDGNYNFTVGSFSSSNSNTRVITMGSGQWTLTGNNTTIWATATTTGLTFTRGANAIICNYAGPTGTRNIGAGGLTESTCPSFNITAGTDTVSTGGGTTNYYNMDFTGFTGTWSNGLKTIYGNVTLNSGMTMTDGTNTTTFSGTSGQIITSNSVTWGGPITQSGVGGTVQFADAFTMPASRTYTHSNGTIDFNSKNISVGAFDSTNSNIRVLTNTGGGGQLELTTTAATAAFSQATSTNATVNLTGLTIKIDGSTSNSRTFAGGGKTYGSLWYTNATASGSIVISGSNTFSDIKCLDTNTQSILFTAGTTTTVTTFTVTGASGKEIRINSASASTATHALVKAGGGQISCDYLMIAHSVATPSGTWYAGANSINNQAITTAGSGWNFTVPPALTAIKTLIGLSYSSTKAVMGLAIASMKQFTGLT